MPEKKFELGDYVEVKDRIKLFYELYGGGRLVTEDVSFPEAGDGKPRVMVKALAYRTPDDPHPGVGYSWLELPGKTPYTNGSEIENAETSAWGRAIGSLGILIDRSIASANEVQNKAEPTTVNGGPPPAHAPLIPPNVETETLTGDLKRAGTIRKGTGAGYKLDARQGPDGHVIGFRLETKDGNIPQVVVAGDAGEKLYLAASAKPETLVGARIELKGRLFHVTRPGAESFYRLHVSEWATADYAYPAPDEDAGPEPPPDVPLVGERPEAETAELFDDVVLA